MKENHKEQVSSVVLNEQAYQSLILAATGELLLCCPHKSRLSEQSKELSDFLTNYLESRIDQRMAIAKYEKPKADHKFIGTWHIYEMEAWDEEYFNMEMQAYIEIRPDNLGNFQFGLVSGYLDGYIEAEDGKERFAFTWEGQDEMEPTTGSGWVKLKGKSEVVGVIKLHLGDRSTFKARYAS